MSGDYSDSEDDGPIPYKSDDESEDDDLARKITIFYTESKSISG